MESYICEYAGFRCLLTMDNDKELVHRLRREFGFYYSIRKYKDEKYQARIDVLGRDDRYPPDHCNERICIHSSHSRNRKVLLDGSSYMQKDASVYAFRRNRSDFVIEYYLENGVLVECCQKEKRVKIYGKNLYGILVYTYETLLNNFLESQGGILLHAASCEMDGKGYLLTGRSGAGKTTLLFDMVKKGAKFHGNDRLAVFERNNELIAYSIPIPVNVPLKTMKNLDIWKQTELVKQAEEGCKIRFLVGELDKLFGQAMVQRITIHSIFCLEYKKSGMPTKQFLKNSELIPHLDLLTPFDECHPKWLPLFSKIKDNQIKHVLEKMEERSDNYFLSGDSLFEAFVR